MIFPSRRHEFLRQLLAHQGGAWLTMAGDSMCPTLRRGQRVRVVSPSELRVGDVVVFGLGSSLVTHRLLARLPGGWLVHAGDLEPRWANLAPAESVVGRAVVERRYVSRLSSAAAALRALRRSVSTWRWRRTRAAAEPVSRPDSYS